MIDLNDAKNKDILEQFLISLTAIAILSFALAYKLDLFKRMQKAIYVLVMGAVAVAGVTLFMVFPAKEVREAVHDDNVASDLTTIELAIGEYYKKEDNLPADLNDLTITSEKNNNKPYLDKDNLNYGIKGYEYTITSSGSGGRRYYYSSPQYQVCAEFKTNTIDDDDRSPYYSYGSYGYRYHESGRYCFDRSVNGRSVIYDDYDYYNSGSNNYYKDEDEEGGEDDITASIRDALDDFNASSDGSCTEVEITKDGVKCSDDDNNDEDEYNWSWLDDDEETNE
jgi:hypothetical protein